ncbi:FtsX-like permease family protein [Kribbella sp. NPDC020789]
MTMTLSTTLLLARSRTAADRSRIRLATGALAFSGALLINGVHVGLLGTSQLSQEQFSSYIAQPGLRPGVCAIVVVLALLAASLAVQCLRIGTAARERRFAALHLAGATPTQVRRLSIADATLVGLIGGLLSGPVYVVFTALLGELPLLVRVFPGLSLSDLLVWVAVTGVLTLSGTAIGRLTHRDPATSDVSPGLPRAMGLISGAALVVIGLAASAGYNIYALPLTIGGLALLWMALAPQRIQALGRRLGAAGDPAQLLAGARLAADTRPVARLGALLLACGFLFGLVMQMSLFVVAQSTLDDLPFYLTGFVLSGFGLVLIALIALAALTVGVADQLVDQRRQLACLTALGVDVEFLRRVVRSQIVLVASPALVLGSCLGLVVGPAGPGSYLFERPSVLSFAAGLIGLLLLSWGISSGGAALAAHLLRNQLRDALDPENLRAA